MPCVHYKFASKLNYDIIVFDGPHISLGDLKKQIMGREKLKATNNDLQITSEQTKEEYTDNALIPKNSSVIVRRIPTVGVQSTRKTSVISQIASLAEANVSEEDKIKAMMLQSSLMYNPINYVKKPLGPQPLSHIRFRRGKPGHYSKNWAASRDENFESSRRLRKSTGIPRSFMMEVKDLHMKGAMLTNTGKYAIPMIDAEAHAIGKKEKPPLLPEEPSSSSEKDRATPDEFLCLICKDILTDAAIIPCCGNSYCDECIRAALLESDEHTCPTCHQDDVSPDALVANKFLRRAVNNFKNETGYTKSLRTQLPPPPPPIAPPGQHGERSQRTQGPSLPATPVVVPGPSPPLDPPPPQMWPLPPHVPPPPQCSPQFPPGQPPPAGYSVPPPGFSPAPANIYGVSPGVQTAHSNTIPTTQALPMSREEFYRVQRQLREEEKKNSKLELTNNFAKELMEYKKIQKVHRCSFSRSNCPYGESSYSRNSYSYSESRSGSTRSCSRSFSRLHSRSYSRSPSYPRRGRGKSRNDRSRSRSRGYHRSRSRSPPYRRYHSRSRPPQAFKGQSPTKRNVPRGETEHEYFNRCREVPPPYDTKDYSGWSVDFRDPFEKERYREWERKYREWYEQCYKGYAVGANREDLSPETPLSIRNSPFIRGCGEDYAAGQSHRNRNLGGNYPEKFSTRDSHNQKDNAQSKEKESDSIPGDDKENKHKKCRKQRKGEERESFPNPELLETPRKSRESSGIDDTKTDILFILPCRDDATPVRDEPMEAESTSFKSVTETDKGEKDKPEVKSDKTNPKSDGSATAKKESH